MAKKEQERDFTDKLVIAEREYKQTLAAKTELILTLTSTNRGLE